MAGVRRPGRLEWEAEVAGEIEQPVARAEAATGKPIPARRPVISVGGVGDERGRLANARPGWVREADAR